MLNILWSDAERVSPALDAPISEYRREKLASIKNEQARLCSLCAELLLQESVRRADNRVPLPLSVETDEYGKPFLSGRAYEFSLSHSGRYAACALSDVPVGLDIQILTKYDERLVRRFFAEGEQESIRNANDRDTAFTRLWCRKESFLKAIGTGLRLPLDSFDVSGDQPSALYRDTVYGFRECRAEELFFCVCMPVDSLPDLIRPIQIELPF